MMRKMTHRAKRSTRTNNRPTTVTFDELMHAAALLILRRQMRGKWLIGPSPNPAI